MADRKITAHTAITAAQVDPTNDVIEIVDISDTTDAASGTNKKMTPTEFLSLFKSFFINVAGTFTSVFANTNTAARTYTFMDRDGTIMDGFNDRMTGSTLNRYHHGGSVTQSSFTSAIVVNFLRATPIRINFPCTIDRIICEVTAGTSGKIRLGIYSNNPSGGPNALLVDGGELTVTAPGIYSSTVSLTLLPGLYWLAYLSDTANTLRHSGIAENVMGWPSTLGSSQNGLTWTVAKTYGALPDPYTAGGSINNLIFPLICVRFV